LSSESLSKSSSSLSSQAAADFLALWPLVLAVFMILSRRAISTNSSTMRKTEMARVSITVRMSYSPQGRDDKATTSQMMSGSSTRNCDNSVTTIVCFLNFFFW